MIASVLCPVCGGWHSTKLVVSKDELGADGIRRIELTGRMDPCPDTRVQMTIVRTS